MEAGRSRRESYRNTGFVATLEATCSSPEERSDSTWRLKQREGETQEQRSRFKVEPAVSLDD